MLFSWKKLAEQRGGRMGDIIDCLNGFHYTSAKSMTFFFSFRRILYPLHICLLHNMLYPRSIDLPASVLQTSASDIYYKLLLFYHPTHCLRRLLCLVLQCSCSESVIFHVVFPLLSVLLSIKLQQSCMHSITCLYQSLAWPVFGMIARALLISGPEVMRERIVWGQGCAFHLNICLFRLIKSCTGRCNAYTTQTSWCQPTYLVI